MFLGVSMRSLFKIAAVLAGIVFGSAAQAATYSVDGLLNYSANGFTTSVVHSQDANGDMSGSVFGTFSPSVAPGGIWQMNGDIAFSGTILGVDYAVTGNIDTSGGGSLSFDFDQTDSFSLSGMATKDAYRAAFFASDHTFNFDGSLAMGPANSFDGNIISLWGDTGTCSSSDPATSTGTCYGIDLRIAVSEIPLPASALLLGVALGGLSAFRRSRTCIYTRRRAMLAR